MKTFGSLPLTTCVVVVSLVIATSGGCKPAATTSTAPATSAQPAATQGPAASAPVDGERAEFGDYAFTLPKGFQATEVPEGALPHNMRIGVWKLMIDETNPAALFLANSMTDAQQAKTATQNMRQALVNYSAGTTDSMGIKIQQRGKTETTQVNGITLTHFNWLAQRADGKQMGGVVYGFVEGDTMTTLLHMVFEGDPETVMSEMKQHIASFHRM